MIEGWEAHITELAENDDEVAEYVRALEQAQDTTELPEASGDAIAREFERYLRRRGADAVLGRPLSTPHMASKLNVLVEAMLAAAPPPSLRRLGPSSRATHRGVGVRRPLQSAAGTPEVGP